MDVDEYHTTEKVIRPDSYKYNRHPKKVKDDSNVYVTSIVETVLYMLISMLVILCIRSFVFQIVNVSGTSMNPTLLDNDHLIIDKISYKFKDIQRFDIIVFKPFDNDDDEFYVKRIIGLPGEEVFIEDGNIYINGEILDEDYGNGQITESKELTEPVTLGDDEYFVLGDNREVSSDSRILHVGNVKRDSIVGKAFYVIYPIDNLGTVVHE